MLFGLIARPRAIDFWGALFDKYPPRGATTDGVVIRGLYGSVD